MSDSIFTDVCRKCPCQRPACVTRSAPADVAIVVDFPTDHDHKKDTFLQGDSGTLARRTLEAYGINVDECYVTSALNCRPAKDKKGVLKTAMLACRERLILELRRSGAKKVLCLGPVGFSALVSAVDVLPITKVRGRWRQAYGMNILATFNPTMLMGAFEYYRDMLADLEKFSTMDGPDSLPNIEMWVPETIKEVREALEYIEDASYVTLDIESTGFSPVKDDLLAVGLGVLYEGTQDGLSIILDRQILEKRTTWRLIGELLARESQATVMHNAKFDLKWIKRWLEKFGIAFLPTRIEDTMLLNYCLDERAMGQFQAHSLKNMARVRCDSPDYDINMGKWIKAYKTAVNEGNWDEVHRLWAKMRTYLSLDCYYTARLYEQLPDEVAEESLDLFNLYHEMFIPGTLALVDIESHGILTDRAFYERTWADLQKRSAPILERIRAATGNPEFNPNSVPQVKKFVYQDLEMPFGIKEQQMYARAKESRASGNAVTGKGMAAAKGKVQHTARRGKLQEGPTSKAVLKSLHKRFTERDPHNAIPDILEYRNLTKTAGTYVKGMLERVDDDDRVRGDFLQHGTSTGRLSSANPNLQNIPETSHTKIEIRNGFVAPDGWVLLNADYSQLELRLAAHLSEDEAFQKVYIEGRDVHQEVAFAFFKKPEDEISPYERYMAKCVNFGVVYGRGAESIAMGPEMEYVEEIGGERWTTKQVSEFFTAFFDNFPKFREWCDEQKRFAYLNQYIESPLGRRRRFPLILRSDGGAVGRQAVNTPIQGTASDFTFSALIRIHRRICEMNRLVGQTVAFIVSTVHDSILIECQKAYAEKVSAIVYEEMENPPLESRVPFKAEIKIGKRWGDLHKQDRDLEIVAADLAEAA